MAAPWRIELDKPGTGSNRTGKVVSGKLNHSTVASRFLLLHFLLDRLCWFGGFGGTTTLVLVHCSLETGQIAATRILLDQIAAFECFERWITLDIVFLAHGAVNGAVDFANEHRVIAAYILGQFNPSRVHLFAVAAPWGEELDK